MSALQNALDYVRAQTNLVPQIAVVLGSGMGDVLQPDNVCCCIAYADIPHFPSSTVEGHAGQFLFGTLHGVPIVVAKGRVHYYEGYDMTEVVMPIRLMRMAGAKALILTNAAGGIRADLAPGSLMLLTDHIASFVPSPLRGTNDDVLGTRFPDMSSVYDRELSEVMFDTAQTLDIPLHQGVYLQTSGPQYETPQEVRMYALCGADAVGMSTAVEAIAAVHCSMRVCAISCITNVAAGMQHTPLSHAEVQFAGKQTAPSLRALLQSSIVKIANIL